MRKNVKLTEENVNGCRLITLFPLHLKPTHHLASYRRFKDAMGNQLSRGEIPEEIVQMIVSFIDVREFYKVLRIPSKILQVSSTFPLDTARDR